MTTTLDSNPIGVSNTNVVPHIDLDALIKKIQDAMYEVLSDDNNHELGEVVRTAITQLASGDLQQLEVAYSSLREVMGEHIFLISIVADLGIQLKKLRKIDRIQRRSLLNQLRSEEIELYAQMLNALIEGGDEAKIRLYRDQAALFLDGKQPMNEYERFLQILIDRANSFLETVKPIKGAESFGGNSGDQVNGDEI